MRMRGCVCVCVVCVVCVCVVCVCILTCASGWRYWLQPGIPDIQWCSVVVEQGTFLQPTQLFK